MKVAARVLVGVASAIALAALAIWLNGRGSLALALAVAGVLGGATGLWLDRRYGRPLRRVRL